MNNRTDERIVKNCKIWLFRNVSYLHFNKSNRIFFGTAQIKIFTKVLCGDTQISKKK